MESLILVMEKTVMTETVKVEMVAVMSVWLNLVIIAMGIDVSFFVGMVKLTEPIKNNVMIEILDQAMDVMETVKSK